MRTLVCRECVLSTTDDLSSERCRAEQTWSLCLVCQCTVLQQTLYFSKFFVSHTLNWICKVKCLVTVEYFKLANSFCWSVKSWASPPCFRQEIEKSTLDSQHPNNVFRQALWSQIVSYSQNLSWNGYQMKTAVLANIYKMLLKFNFAVSELLSCLGVALL